MSKVKELEAYLVDPNLALRGLTLEQEPTASAVAEAILESLKRMEEGDFEILYDSEWEEFDD